MKNQRAFLQYSNIHIFIHLFFGLALILFYSGCWLEKKHFDSEKEEALIETIENALHQFQEPDSGDIWSKTLSESLPFLFSNKCSPETREQFLTDLTNALPEKEDRGKLPRTKKEELDRFLENLLPYLAQPSTEIELEAEAIARIKCLAQINTPETEKILLSFHAEKRKDVVHALGETINPLEIDIILDDFSTLWSELDGESPYLTWEMRQNIRDISRLSTLKEIRKLDLRNTQITDFTPLQKLESLEWLDLSNTPIQDLSVLSPLKKLSCLIIASTPVTDLSPLKDLPELTDLILCGSDVTNLSPLVNLSKLRVLYADGGSSCGRILREHVQLANLKNIAPLGKIKTLQKLTFRGTKIENSDLEALKELSLKTFAADGTKITDLSVLQNSTELEDLDLKSTDIKDLSSLSQFTHLKKLDIGKTEINDLTPLKNLKKLKSLNLSGTSIQNIPALQEMQELEYLFLNDTQVRDLSPLKNMKSLKYVYVDSHLEEGLRAVRPDLFDHNEDPPILDGNAWKDFLGKFYEFLERTFPALYAYFFY